MVALGRSFSISSLTHGRGMMFGPCGSPVCSLMATLPVILPLTLLKILRRPSAERSLVK